MQALGQIGARPRIFCSDDSGLSAQSLVRKYWSSWPRLTIPHEVADRLLGLSPERRDGVGDLGLLKARPGFGLALLDRRRIDGDERHHRREPVAFPDRLAGGVQSVERDRRVEVVRIGVELVEQVHEVDGR